MIDDIRYLEFKFLSAVATGTVDLFDERDEEKVLGAKLKGGSYIEMVATLLEELYVQFRNEELQRFVSKLRGEASPAWHIGDPYEHLWDDPRRAIPQFLRGIHGGLQQIRITYRGLRRVQELRDMLRYDRILEPHGILLSMQYFRRDLEDALKNSPGVSISVISSDMDNFKRINTDFGHDAGDVVMKAYLGCVRDGLGLFGTGYRGVGDEVLALVVGQGNNRAVALAEDIRKRIAELKCEHKGARLHPVTASIGVASTPPESPTMEIETLATARSERAKVEGKNRVISQ